MLPPGGNKRIKNFSSGQRKKAQSATFYLHFFITFKIEENNM